jgi:hypothetical protein
MHANAVLLNQLFTALHARDPSAMASCYHPEARFRDIAFDLKGRRIEDMWRMICSDDITVEIRHIEADDHAGRASTIDRYSFGKRPVVNPIESRFLFRDGRIVRQDDACDARSWARQALGGGLVGALAGRFRFLRSTLARFQLALWVLRRPGRG